MMDNILPFISKKNVGLDFGCGALTALSEIFQKKEIHLDSFDLYYHPNHSIWNCKYDFIIISEVIEHLHNPEDTMTSLKKILNPNGKIFIKTKFRKESIEFANWFYKRDLTHIQFFNPKSLELFANRLGFAFSEIGPDLYLWN